MKQLHPSTLPTQLHAAAVVAAVKPLKVSCYCQCSLLAVLSGVLQVMVQVLGPLAAVALLLGVVLLLLLLVAAVVLLRSCQLGLPSS